ncbi:MAG TPA: STAS domain-containing protein [Solirubrobacteraceae bacterium]|nr:STAS domain-containing protein [Solirubrobacteraceae bacterium]
MRGEFEIRQKDDRGRHRLLLSGELDMHGAIELEDAVLGLCQAGAVGIEINLRDVTFIDSSGLRAILAARDQCRTRGAELFMVPAKHPGPARLFELMRLDDVLPWRVPSGRGL